MRFLVDENLPRRFADLLRATGHEASHVVDHDLAGAGDDTVMALALDEGAVLITYDADFAAMLVLGERRFPSVVLFRDQHRRTEALARVSSRTSNSSSTRCPKARSPSSTPRACAFGICRSLASN